MPPGGSFDEPVTPGQPLPEPYFFESGFRRVKPYYWEYRTYCKQRWRGREMVDIFTSEFRDRPEEYYVRLLHPPYTPISPPNASN